MDPVDEARIQEIDSFLDRTVPDRLLALEEAQSKLNAVLRGSRVAVGAGPGSPGPQDGHGIARLLPEFEAASQGLEAVVHQARDACSWIRSHRGEPLGADRTFRALTLKMHSDAPAALNFADRPRSFALAVGEFGSQHPAVRDQARQVAGCLRRAVASIDQVAELFQSV